MITGKQVSCKHSFFFFFFAAHNTSANWKQTMRHKPTCDAHNCTKWHQILQYHNIKKIVYAYLMHQSILKHMKENDDKLQQEIKQLKQKLVTVTLSGKKSSNIRILEYLSKGCFCHVQFLFNDCTCAAIHPNTRNASNPLGVQQKPFAGARNSCLEHGNVEELLCAYASHRNTIQHLEKRQALLISLREALVRYALKLETAVDTINKLRKGYCRCALDRLGLKKCESSYHMGPDVWMCHYCQKKKCMCQRVVCETCQRCENDKNVAREQNSSCCIQM